MDLHCHLRAMTCYCHERRCNYATVLVCRGNGEVEWLFRPLTQCPLSYHTRIIRVVASSERFLLFTQRPTGINGWIDGGGSGF
ncbi:hypothetical protein M0802_006243 [Mischocyttarus mexicanus]|nr:hypothetical protein M0802_006243 [Mischocyttarus mexicanus]